MRTFAKAPIAFSAALLAALAGGCLHIPPAPLSPADGAEQLEHRSLADPGLRTFLTQRRAQPTEAWPRTTWGVEDLTLAAIFFSPSLRIARSGSEVARAHEGTAAQRPNPTLQIQPQYLTNNVASGVPPWVSVFTLTWTIETGDKRDARRAVAAAGTSAALANELGTAWQVRGDLLRAAIALRAAEARAAGRDRIVALLTERERLLEDRLALGAASQREIAVVRQARLQSEGLRATSQRLAGEARARLAAALSLPRAALDGLVLAEELESEPTRWTPAATLDVETARHVALLGRSDLLVSLSDYAAAEANLRLQLAQQYPNVVFGPSYEYDQGGHRWGLSLSVSLPLLNQNRGGVEEAAAARDQSAARFEALQTQILAEVDGATASLDGARAERERAFALVRNAEQAKTFAARSLAEGASDRATYLVIELAREEAGLLAVDAQESWRLALARLELAVRPVGTVDATLRVVAAP
ncbi:MAG: TolC family protein [Myxococcota bacterium]